MKAYYKYLIVSAALVAAWFLLAYRPSQSGQRDLDNRLDQIQSEIADFQSTVAACPQELKTKIELEQSRQELNSALIAKQDILELFRELSRQAEASRLEIKEITPPLEELLELNSAASAPGQPEFINITLRMEGTFRDFGDYLSYMEQAGYFRGINQCSAMIGSPDQRGLDLQVEFRALLGGFKEDS